MLNYQMEGLEYYKSLVSDDEVVNALIKDSRSREGLLEKTRVRPNIKFFQRTVTNLVSSNNRVLQKQNNAVAIEKEKNKVYRPKKIQVKKKQPIEYIKEMLSHKIEFVKSSESAIINTETSETSALRRSYKSRSNPQHSRHRKTILQRKSPFQQIREILANNVCEVNNVKSKLGSNEITCSDDVPDIYLSRKVNNLPCTIILTDSDS